MARLQSNLTTQGQISVPAEICRRLGLGPGSVLEWEEDGQRVVVPKPGRFSSEEIHRAVFVKRPEPRKLAELNKAIGRHVQGRRAGR